jgi:hypothetical protein
MRPLSRRCVALAISAWLAVTLWFLLGTFGGWTGTFGPFLVWTVPGAFLWRSTVSWLRRAGQPPAPRFVRQVVWSWLGLVLCLLAAIAGLVVAEPAVPDAVLLWLCVVYAVHPLGLAGWAIWRAIAVARTPWDADVGAAGHAAV